MIAPAFLPSPGRGGSAFLGGLGTRGLPLRATVSGAPPGGIIVSGVGVMLLGEDCPGFGPIAPATSGGLANLIALLALYKALATGFMSIVALISATGPLVRVPYGRCQGERPLDIQSISMALVLVGVLLASCVPVRDGSEAKAVPAPDVVGTATTRRHLVRSRGPRAPSLILAGVSALANGVALVAVSSVAETSPHWGMVAVLSATLASMLVFLAIARRGVGTPARRLPGLLAIGPFEAIATGLLAVATAHGYLSVVAVVASLFPLGTIALARLTLGERTIPHQNAGVAIALTGAAHVAVG